MIAARIPGASPTKKYVVRLVRPDGGREIVADTALLSEALAHPRLLRHLTRRPHDSVEADTGRPIYPR